MSSHSPGLIDVNYVVIFINALLISVNILELDLIFSKSGLLGLSRALLL